MLLIIWFDLGSMRQNVAVVDSRPAAGSRPRAGPRRRWASAMPKSTASCILQLADLRQSLVDAGMAPGATLAAKKRAPAAAAQGWPSLCAAAAAAATAATASGGQAAGWGTSQGASVSTVPNSAGLTISRYSMSGE